MVFGRLRRTVGKTVSGIDNAVDRFHDRQDRRRQVSVRRNESRVAQEEQRLRIARARAGQIQARRESAIRRDQIQRNEAIRRQKSRVSDIRIIRGPPRAIAPRKIKPKNPLKKEFDPFAF